MPAESEVESQVEVVFLPDDARATVAAGATILEAGTAAGIDLLTGCTEGMCGTDAVQVVAGLAGLAEAGEPERGTLERMGLGAEYRLACSARILSGSVHVRTDAF